MIGLEQEYAKLRIEIRGLSKDARDSAEGIAKIKLADSLKSQILEVESSIKDFKGNIGNYGSALGNVGDLLTGGLITGGITAAIAGVSSQLIQGGSDVIEYSNKLQELSAITGVSGDALKNLENSANELTTIVIADGQEIKNTASDIFEAFKLVGSAKPELLNNQEALAAVTKEAIILSKASGEDLASSVNTLTTVMGQFNAPAESANRIINQLAAGSKVGAAETKDVATSIKEFGLVASNSNISITESVALIETLADKQLKGAEAGNQLKNILTKLSAPENLPKDALDSFSRLGVSIDVLKDKSIPLEDRLQELSKLQGNAGVLAKAFGTENLQAAQILTGSLEKYKEFNAGIDGTNTAYEQAGIITQSYGEKVNQISVSYKEARATVSEFLVTALLPVLSGINSFFGVLKETPKFIKENKEELLLLAIAIASLNINLITSTANLIKDNAVKSIATIRTAAQTAAQTALNFVLNANPIGLVISAVALLSAGFVKLYKSSETTRASFSGLFEFGKELISIFVEAFKSFGDGFNKLKNGDFSGALKSFGDGLIKSNPISLALTQGKRLADAFNKGYNDKLKESKQVTKSEENITDKSVKQVANQPISNINTRELSKKEKEDREKLAKELEKSTEDQEKRIYEIKKKIGELTTQNIENEFDKQIKAAELKYDDEIKRIEQVKEKLDEKIKLQGGKKTINDILESELIAKETAVINKNLEKQKADIEKKRQEAFDSSKKQLEKLQSENLTIIKKANEELVKNELDTINNEFSNRTLEINIRYATDENLINEQFQKGIISEKEYNKQLALLNENKNAEILANEKDAANERLAIYDKELAVKLELLKVEKLNRLNSLQDNTANAKLKAEEDYNKGKIESYDELQKTLKAIDEKYNNESQSIELDTNIKEKAAINEITKLKLEANQKVLESDSQLSTAQIEANKKRAAILKEAISTGLDIAKQVSDTIFSAQSQTAENEKELRLKNLEDEYSKKIEAAKGNATLEAALKKDLEDKKLAIERQAFEENKKRQIAQALINGALAVTAILTVPDLTFGIVTAIKIAAAAATTALQVAAIKNTKFRYGGFTGSGFGQPDETGRKIAGYVHENEYVANEEQVRKYPKLFEYLNNDRLKKFRDGGFTSDFIPDVTGYSKVDYSASKPGVSFTDEQIDNIAERISQRTYEAVKKGSQEGSMSGTYLANTDTNRQAEREQNLVANTTF